MEESSKRLGRFIRQRRDVVGINQTQLGDAIGREQKYISEIERGAVVNLPAPDVIRRIALELRCSEYDILSAAGYLEPHNPHPEHLFAEEVLEARRAAEGLRTAADALVRRLIPERAIPFGK